jgi:chromosome segregation ATPase
MSEIKIALDLFEKGNKLTQVVNGLKAVDGLVKTINRKKINLLSDDLDKKLKTLGDITRLVRQIDKEKKKEVANQEKLNRKLKQEAGILGGLKKRVKDLKLDQNAAKTTKELDKVNKELQEAQMNVRKFGALGKKNTNTFSNALSSFGFKFNFLSDIISGTAFALVVLQTL